MTDIFDRAMKQLQHVADVTGYDYDVGVGMEALEEQQKQIKELKDALWPFLYGGVPLAPMTKLEYEYIVKARKLLASK